MTSKGSIEFGMMTMMTIDSITTFFQFIGQLVPTLNVTRELEQPDCVIEIAKEAADFNHELLVNLGRSRVNDTERL